MIDYCEVVRNIHKDPFIDVKQWGVLTVRHFMELREHLRICAACAVLVDSVIETHKDVPFIDPTSLN